MKLMMKIELAVNLVSDGDVGSGLKLLSTALKKNVNQFFLEKNSDKKILKQHIKSFVDLFKSESSTIDELFTLLKEIRILSDYDYDILLERYQIIFQLNLHQIVKLNNFLKRPDYSTQHGVKGEGHKKVLFICGATNSTPFIDMYSFLDFWADNNLNLRKIQSLYYNYSNFVKEILSTLKVSLSRIKTDLYNEHISFIEKSVVKYKSFLDDEIFSKLYGDAYERYMLSKTKTNFVNMIKPKKLRNIVMSFKLFYVGCSRAKEELIIYIDESKLQNKSAVFQKMKSLGFDLNN
jgi:DNA helicase-2/ATP-dependent DNA helicase PcrA